MGLPLAQITLTRLKVEMDAYVSTTMYKIRILQDPRTLDAEQVVEDFEFDFEPDRFFDPWRLF